MHTRLVVILLALLVVLGTAASADTVSSIGYMDWSPVCHAMGFAVNNYTLLTFDPWTQAGETFWFTSNQDSPDFSLAAHELTDGARDVFLVNQPGGGGGYTTDWFPGVYGTGKLDFIGHHIDGIGLTINGYNPFYNSVDYTFMVDYSAVPEPSSLIALLCGVGGIGGMMWRRRKA